MKKNKSTREMLYGDEPERKKDKKATKEDKGENIIEEIPPAQIEEPAYFPPKNQPAQKRQPKEKNKQKEPKQKLSRRPISSIIKSKFFIGMICLGLAVVIAFAVIPAAQLEINDTVTVVTVNKNLAAPTVITAEVVTVVQMSKYNLPKGYLSDENDVIGKYLTVDAVKGDILTDERISDTDPGDAPVLMNLPVGKYAVSINLPDIAASVSSKIRKGDIISIYATFANEIGKSDYYAQNPTELQYVEVIGVADAAADNVDNSSSNSSITASSSSSTIQTITLMVNSQQAAALFGLSDTATIHTALVSRGNEELKAKLLAMQEELIKASSTANTAPAQ